MAMLAFHFCSNEFIASHLVPVEVSGVITLTVAH